MNVALYPNSDNVYDSLADAYANSGDSLQAFDNYNKALELNSGNERAKTYVEAYGKELIDSKSNYTSSFFAIHPILNFLNRCVKII